MFNPIETYFAVLKNHYKKAITKRRLSKNGLKPNDIVECIAESCARITVPMQRRCFYAAVKDMVKFSKENDV